MKLLNLLTLLVVIIGGVNWGLVGAAGLDLVAAIVDAGSWQSRGIYLAVGVSAIYQLLPFTHAVDQGQISAEADATAGP